MTKKVQSNKPTWKILISIACLFFSYLLLINKPIIFLVCWLLLPLSSVIAYSNKSYPFREEDGSQDIKHFLFRMAFGCLIISAALGYLMAFSTLFGHPECTYRGC